VTVAEIATLVGQISAQRKVLGKAEETNEAGGENEGAQQPNDPVRQRMRRRKADSTDWFSSQLTRRFGSLPRPSFAFLPPLSGSQRPPSVVVNH
jgi:hypothetical protein